MSQSTNTYTVTTRAGVVEVEGVAASTEVVDGFQHFAVWADECKTKANAIFARWEYVTVERPEPVGAGPFQGRTRCASPDCLKHNGASPTSAEVANLISTAVERGFAAGLDAARQA